MRIKIVWPGFLLRLKCHYGDMVDVLVTKKLDVLKLNRPAHKTLFISRIFGNPFESSRSTMAVYTLSHYAI